MTDTEKRVESRKDETLRQKRKKRLGESCQREAFRLSQESLRTEQSWRYVLLLLHRKKKKSLGVHILRCYLTSSSNLRRRDVLRSSSSSKALRKGKKEDNKEGQDKDADGEWHWRRSMDPKKEPTDVYSPSQEHRYEDCPVRAKGCCSTGSTDTCMQTEARVVCRYRAM